MSDTKSPLKQIQKSADDMIRARAKASAAKHYVIRMDAECGYFNFMVECEADDNHIVAHYPEISNPKSKSNAEFAVLAANRAALHAEVIKEMSEALELVRDMGESRTPYTRHAFVCVAADTLASVAKKLGMNDET